MKGKPKKSEARIRESLEYLRQAAQNPKFDNDYSLDVEDLSTTLSSYQSEDLDSASTKQEDEEVKKEEILKEVNIFANVTIIGYNVFKKSKSSKQEFLVNQLNEK